MHCGDPHNHFRNLGMICSSAAKAQGPQRPPVSLKIVPSGLHLGDKPGYLHHFLPPTQAVATISCLTLNCHLGLKQTVQAPERVCGLQAPQVSGPPHYPAPSPAPQAPARDKGTRLAGGGEAALRGPLGTPLWQTGHSL